MIYVKWNLKNIIPKIILVKKVNKTGVDKKTKEILIYIHKIQTKL